MVADKVSQKQSPKHVEQSKVESKRSKLIYKMQN